MLSALNVTDVFNVTDENSKFSKFEVLKIQSSQNLKMEQTLKSVDFNPF